jgi:hypothetical protein
VIRTGGLDHVHLHVGDVERERPDGNVFEL